MKADEELIELTRLQAKELITIKKGIIALVLLNLAIGLLALGQFLQISALTG
jgi:hypothetical protein